MAYKWNFFTNTFDEVGAAGAGTGTVTEVATGAGLAGGPITTTGTVSLDSKLAPLDTIAGQALKVPRVNAGETALEYVTPNAGTVTDISIATEDGVSGTVSNSTTTPVLHIAVSKALNDLSDVNAPSPAAGNHLEWNGSEWAAAVPTQVVGSASTFYLDATAIVADNLALSTTPSVYAEVANIKTVLIATSPVFFERFVSGPLGRTSIPAGTWVFNNYASIDADAGTANKIQFRVNKRVEKSALKGSFSGAGASRTWTMTNYAITAVDTGLKQFTIAGDHQFDVGMKIVVTGSTGNNGTYTVVSAVFGAATVITVSEAVPSAVADGVLRAAPFVAGDANASRLLAGLIETPTQTGWISVFTNAYTVTIVLTDAGFVNVTDVSLNAIYYYLFNDEGGDMNGSVATLYSKSSVQPAFSGLNLTDRLVVAFFATSDSDTGADTMTLYYGGAQHFTHFTTPLSTLHNDLAGLNVGDYLHLTATEKTKFSAPSGAFVGDTDTQTLTNKRINPRVTTASDATSITPAGDTADVVIQANTQAVGTLTMNAPSGTPVDGQKLIIRIKSTNVQTFAWNGVYRGSVDLALPTVSSGAGKTDYFGFIYNSADTKWDLVAQTKGF